jgi:transposase
MGCHQVVPAEQTARRSKGQRPPCPQWHLLGVAVRSALAGTCRTVLVRTPPATIAFVRRQRAGVWGKIMDALAGAHDVAVQMIDMSIVRVHQHGR